MAMSQPSLEDEGGYTTIDLANKPAPATDIEIVDETAAPTIEVEEEPAAVSVAPAPAPAADDDDDDAEPDASGDKKRLTRTQRLKAARDAANARAAHLEAQVQQMATQLAQRDQQASEGAAISLDLYIQTLDDRVKALRRDYDAAFDSGDRDKLWEVQQQMSSLAAQKEAAQQERRQFPTQANPSGGAAQPPQPTTTAPQPPQQNSGGNANPLAVAWAREHTAWFNKDKRMTRRALVHDADLIDDGWDPDTPEYYAELNKRLQKDFPEALGTRAAPPRTTNSPVISNRAAPPAAGGTVKVRITQADKEMAASLGLDIATYARQKLRMEQAQGTANQYTEIL
jgi:hypothetical protein